MLNSVCAIGMWAIAPCANGIHSIYRTVQRFYI